MPVVPSAGEVHVNRPLTNMSVAFLQDPGNFVARSVFPTIPVLKQGDIYFVFPRDAFNRDEMALRAISSETAEARYAIEQDNYFADVWGLHTNIDDRIRANTDLPLNPDRNATQMLNMKGLIRQERQWVSQYFTAGAPGAVWTFVADGVAAGAEDSEATFDPTSASLNDVVQWSDYANSQPVEDIRRAKTIVLEQTGFEPNMATLGQRVYDKLVDHPDIVGRLDRGQTPNGPARANRQSLAMLFEVDEVMVMKAIHNSSPQGVAAVHAFIGGKHALLSYKPPVPAIEVPSAGYTFVWTSYPGATNDQGVVIRKFRVEPKRSDRVEIEMAFAMKRVSEDLGFFFNGIVA